MDLGPLGLDAGGHILVARKLSEVEVDEAVEVRGTDPRLSLHLTAWSRAHGHRVEEDPDGGLSVRKGRAETARWHDAERAGGPEPGGIVDKAPARWGLAARGALVEMGGPDLTADLVGRDEVWSDIAPRLYAQAAAGQWDPATAVDWDADFELADEIEDAVVQVMTYLIENEQAALAVPSRFISRVHPHYREVVQFLAVQVADEARHIEVFSRRASLRRDVLGESGAGGRASLQTLLAEPDFALATFMLSVLGEGTFLNLLSFLDRFAPDPVTRQVAHLALQDEARHVAFGQAHLEHRVAVEPVLRDRLRAAMHRRHDALADTAGLHEGVFDALVILAAGEWTPAAIAVGWDRVQDLQAAMDDGRQRRLVRLGFDPSEAAELSALHTRNFM